MIYVVGDTELNENIKDIVIKSATDSLNEIKELLISNKVKVREPEVIFGKIVDTIVQKANAEKVNLVLIGAKEKNKRENFKLGVISEQIIRECDVPVWMISGEKKALFSSILCPVDFSEPSKRALTNAILLARKFSARLNIITVYEPIEYVSRRINIDLDEENALRLKKVKNEMKTFMKEFDLEGIV